jgi:hypothetical protein
MHTYIMLLLGFACRLEIQNFPVLTSFSRSTL